jgi:hypothetical protein
MTERDPGGGEPRDAPEAEEPSVEDEDFTDLEDDPAYDPDDPELKRLKGG